MIENHVVTDWVASEVMSMGRRSGGWGLTYSLGNSPSANEHSSEVLPQAPVIWVKNVVAEQSLTPDRRQQ